MTYLIGLAGGVCRGILRDISDLADRDLLPDGSLSLIWQDCSRRDSEQRLDWRINSLKKISLLSSAGRIYRIENLAVSDLKIDGMKEFSKAFG